MLLGAALLLLHTLDKQFVLSAGLQGGWLRQVVTCAAASP